MNLDNYTTISGYYQSYFFCSEVWPNCRGMAIYIFENTEHWKIACLTIYNGQSVIIILMG